MGLVKMEMFFIFLRDYVIKVSRDFVGGVFSLRKPKDCDWFIYFLLQMFNLKLSILFS